MVDLVSPRTSVLDEQQILELRNRLPHADYRKIMDELSTVVEVYENHIQEEMKAGIPPQISTADILDTSGGQEPDYISKRLNLLTRIRNAHSERLTGSVAQPIEGYNARETQQIRAHRIAILNAFLRTQNSPQAPNEHVLYLNTLRRTITEQAAGPSEPGRFVLDLPENIWHEACVRPIATLIRTGSLP